MYEKLKNKGSLKIFKTLQNYWEKMMVCVNARMSKIIRTPIKVGVRTNASPELVQKMWKIPEIFSKCSPSFCSVKFETSVSHLNFWKYSRRYKKYITESENFQSIFTIFRPLKLVWTVKFSPAALFHIYFLHRKSWFLKN